MNYNEYRKIICATPETRGLEYEIAFMWLNPGRLPIGVVSLNGCKDKIIRVPVEEINPHSNGKNRVPVIGVAREAFAGNTDVTDIILPSGIQKIGGAAFSGCTSLERISIPKAVKRIGADTFKDCISLRDIYYEGTFEEWNKIEVIGDRREVEFGSLVPGSPVQEIVSERLIRSSGNEALRLANIHFRCELPSMKNAKQFFRKDGKQGYNRALSADI